LKVVDPGFGWRTGGLIWYVDQSLLYIVNRTTDSFKLGKLYARSKISIISTRHRVSIALASGDFNSLIYRIYIIPNADDGPTWTATVQHIAKEGRCFVISVNQFCKVSDFPADYPPFTIGSTDRNPENEGAIWQKDDVVNRGGSCILGPLGTFLVKPVRDKEVILYATLQHSELIEARVSLLCHLSYVYLSDKKLDGL
jgi:hypothetical protein